MIFKFLFYQIIQNNIYNNNNNFLVLGLIFGKKTTNYINFKEFINLILFIL